MAGSQPPQTPQTRRQGEIDFNEASPTAELLGHRRVSEHDATTLGFQSNTIAATPPQNTSLNLPAGLPYLNTDPIHVSSEALGGVHPTPVSAGLLRLKTDVRLTDSIVGSTDHGALISPRANDTETRHPKTIHVPSRAPSIRQALVNSLGSASNAGSAPNSALSSPMLNAMTDVTPLPSPLMSSDSPGPWRKVISRPTSREFVMPGPADSVLVTTNGESVTSALLNQSKRRAYHGLIINSNDNGLNDTSLHRESSDAEHSRNRSVSEYTPEPMHFKPRNQAASGSYATLTEAATISESPTEIHMRREPHMAVKRGLAPARPLTPPSSRTGAESSDSDSSLTTGSVLRQKKSRYEYFYANTLDDNKRRRWRALKLLGEGTFSKVMLATSQAHEENTICENDVAPMEGVLPAHIESHLDPKKLVAVKICEHGPKGGASEERVEMSLKRELEIMKSIQHPSLVHLKAWSVEDTRAILILSYCPGGDLFDVASQSRDLLVPSLLRRMFAELIAAVQYLHERHIVHRDIKLENILVNLPRSELMKPMDWTTYPYSVITLTDLGLSRRVADDEKLTTRCGSDDYAAPEVILGQPYDGRAVDAWSLGVLLYALIESRLPFDPTPGMSEGHKQRSKTSHRIARVEWCWILYAGEDGDHDGDIAKFEQAGLEGAMEITEGFLKRARSRWTIAKAAEHPWVKDAVKAGVSFREEDIPEEVSTL